MTKRSLDTTYDLLADPASVNSFPQTSTDVEHFSLESDNESEGEDDLQFGEGNDFKRQPLPEENLLVRSGDYNDSDCSSDEEEVRNRIGNIPMEWYNDYDHIGYNIHGEKVGKTIKDGDQLDKLLDRMDNPDFWRTVHNKQEGENVVLKEDDIAIINKLKSNKFPDLGYNPYEPYIDFITYDKLETPLVDTPEPKRRFIPSKHEHKKVMKLIRAIRNGWIKPKEDKPKKPSYYDLWGTKEDTQKQNPMHMPAPKLTLPGNEESYNPPEEYLPTKEERDNWENTDQEDRTSNFLPNKYSCLRHVPAYPQLINEKFDRCLDLYLCPRKIKMKLNMNPDDLLPKLPKPKDLKPFPTSKAIKFSDHVGHVYSVDASKSGEFIVSGGQDKILRIWESSTGRLLSKVALPDSISSVKWNKVHSMIAASSGNSVYIMNPGFDDKLVVDSSNKILQGLTDISELDNCRWYPMGNDKDGLKMKIVHNHQVGHITWHSSGNFLAVTMRESPSCSVLIHNITKHSSQKPFNKSKGQIQQVEFHPNKPFFFVLSQRYVRIYNLVKQTMVRKLICSVKWASSMAIHPKGDNLIVGSYDKTLVWFDMDLSVKPYKSLQQHKGAIRDLCFHPHYPLYASCSDDCSAVVSHGMVYNDLIKNPLVVPVKVLRGHTSSEKYGVLSNVFHPFQPWLFTGGADGDILLYV